MGSNPGEVRLQMPEIEKADFIREEIAKMKSDLSRASSKGPKIQRVSSVLKSIKSDCLKYFEPRIVSIGPLHHGNPMFKLSEEFKRQLAGRFASENGTSCEALFEKIKADIEYLKECYEPEEIIGYDDDKLAWMLFVDGCAFLYAIHYGLQGEFNKLKFKADRFVFAQRDMFLLDNQLPYKVLKILINSAKDSKIWDKTIENFIDDNLITNIQSGQKSQQRKDVDQKENKDYAHFLERYREKFLSGIKEESSSSSMIGRMLLRCGGNRQKRKTLRSIMELKESGIRVKASNSNNPMDISFHCNLMGTLKMPRFLVDDSTATKFLNLVALEMCIDFDNDFAVTSYLSFLDSLIDTAEDVKELRVKGMLHNYLGSDEEVANLFNTMSRDLVPDQGMYFDVTENINKYCNNPLTTSVAKGLYTHFSSPWSFIAFLGALMGLLFSAIQAYYSLFPHDTKST